MHHTKKIINRLFSYVALIIFTTTFFALALVNCSAPTKKSESGSPEIDQAVTVGSDRLLSEFGHLIKGKKLALVTNHTGRLSDGTHLADTLFNYPDAELIVLFGMHFNIRSNDYSLPRDKEKDIDKETGLTKYSLYGEIHKPTPEMLEDVEVIIFDIQEVGARFYEHINILGFIMEAAAENDIELVVLDRPNPINGLKMDGFITDDEFLYGFGAFAKVPIIHGMTMGELASLYNGEKMLRGELQAKLHVIEMVGWERSMWFEETGQTWIKPSPNLPSFESLLAYTGTCLFEGINVSEGRGTEKPFQYIGAPWVDHEQAALLLNDLKLKGVIFEAITFTPQKMLFHGSPPILTGEECKGIYVNIQDRDLFAPYKAGVAMVWAIHKLHPDKMEWNERTMNRLNGTRRLEKMIHDGTPPSEIFASWEEELADFKEMGKGYFLY